MGITIPLLCDYSSVICCEIRHNLQIYVELCQNQLNFRVLVGAFAEDSSVELFLQHPNLTIR